MLKETEYRSVYLIPKFTLIIQLKISIDTFWVISTNPLREVNIISVTESSLTTNGALNPQVTTLATFFHRVCFVFTLSLFVWPSPR